MKLVVDSNALRSDQLRAFLKARRSNLAILIDYASVEAYKKNPLITVQRSMEILGEYPKQVRVLRSTGLIARQDSRKPKYVRRMVWDKYTKTFALHSASLPYIESGEPDMVEGAMRLHAKARELVDQMAPERFREFHEATTELFDPIQHSEIRKGRRSPGTLFQMLEMAAHVAAYQLSDDTVFRDYKLSEVINHFAVRHVLAKIILSQHWIRDGCPSVKDVRLQNDQIDAVFATYGTYFNGLMTADQPAARLHNDLRDCLTALAPSQGVILPKTRSSCCNVA